MVAEKPALLAHTLRFVTRGAWSTASSIRPAWRRQLAVPLSLYGLSCFAYTAVGLHAIALWMACPQAVPEWPARFALPEATAVTIQGVWSFASDVLNVGRDSHFHAIDRVSALSLVALQLIKFGYLLPQAPSMQWMELASVWFGLAIGIVCKLRGFRAILDNSPTGFRRWHTLWHASMPLTFIVWHSSRWLGCDVCSA